LYLFYGTSEDTWGAFYRPVGRKSAKRPFMRSFLLFGLCVAILLAPSAVPQSSHTPDNGRTIRVDVKMVSLPVVVMTREGKRITDLGRDNFQVFENSVPQEISGFSATNEPVKIVLLLDNSDSTESRLAQIQSAAIEFVNQLHPDDEVAVLSFAQKIKVQEDFSRDRANNEISIKKNLPGGWTAIYEAVWLSLDVMLKSIKERKALVLFTDGMDTYSARGSKEETLNLAKETRATIYSVYYNTEDNPQNKSREKAGREYLENLAEYSGGLVFDGNKDLATAYAEVARELSSQYSIGYYSTNKKHDGKFRKLEVKINRPGLVARTKKGYYAK
jgi:Ca-activated chloride channel homolog